MKRIIFLTCSTCLLFVSQTAMCEPVNMSEPSPAISEIYYAGTTSLIIYTLTNHIPAQKVPITVTGISAPVTRQAVSNDCGNVLPVGPSSTCNIGILIAPTSSQIGKSYNQTLTIDYGCADILRSKIAFNVQANVPEISVSQSSIALAANGVSRTITIKVTKGDAFAVNYELSPALPIGTTITPATCGDIKNGKTCVLTITPGSTPSAVAGAAAVPTVMKFKGTNTNASPVNVSVLIPGNIYQQGYLFSIDDTTPTNTGIGGTVVSLMDNSAGIQWYNGENLTVGASSLTDGFVNTTAILSKQNVGNYAASVCANYEIDSLAHSPCQVGSTCYKNWYLPAICQLGPESNASGCPAGMQNMVESLMNQSIGGFSRSSNYWSSTEFSMNPSDFVWYQFFGDRSDDGFQSVSNKYMDNFSVRCVRAIN